MESATDPESGVVTGAQVPESEKLVRRKKISIFSSQIGKKRIVFALMNLRASGRYETYWTA
jgi:hypothetical protein